MMRLFVLWGCLLAVATSAFAGTVEVGQRFPAYTVTDAFGNTNTLQPSTRFVFVASEKGLSQKINDWLTGKGTNYLAERHAEYVSDITAMPGLVAQMFALPKLKKLPFKILLANDKNFAKTYPHRDAKIALFVLSEQGVLKDIQWHETPAHLETALEATAGASSR